MAPDLVRSRELETLRALLARQGRLWREERRRRRLAEQEAYERWEENCCLKGRLEFLENGMISTGGQES
jgi:hypothetical protein